MLARQLINQHLKPRYAFGSGRSEQVLYKFENADNVSFLGRTKFRDQQNDRSQQALRRFIKNAFLSFFKTIMGKSGISPEQKNIIDNCLHEVYRDFLLGNTTAMPTSRDYYEILSKQQSEEAKPLYMSLELYVNGSMKIFSYPSNADANNRVVVYDIKDLGKQLKPLEMTVDYGRSKADMVRGGQEVLSRNQDEKRQNVQARLDNVRVYGADETRSDREGTGTYERADRTVGREVAQANGGNAPRTDTVASRATTVETDTPTDR